MFGNLLKREVRDSPRGSTIELPFGFLYALHGHAGKFFDLQIEGIGTKTLLAELSRRAYATIGVDGVAMVANDIIRSGSTPLLISDAIHISEAESGSLQALIKGVKKGARLSGTTLISGETGEVKEVLHETLDRSLSPPFDLIVSCLGICKRSEMISGKIDEEDIVLGLESSGIHSNGLTLARRILLRRWGGRFSDQTAPEMLGRPVIDELLEPTRLYVKPLLRVSKTLQIKAAVHITGGGFLKFKRLLGFSPNLAKNLGLELDVPMVKAGIFALIFESARSNGKPISIRKMFSTFNMGYGFAVVLPKPSEDEALDLFNKYCPTRKIGVVTRFPGIKLLSGTHESKNLII